MKSLLMVPRVLCAGLAVLFMSNVAVLAGDAAASVAPTAAPDAASRGAVTTPDPAAWQDVIAGQIEAFRKGDAKTALSFASQTFQKNFSDANTFMISIAASGYAPIFTSVSQSFGKFTQPDATTVLQEVELVGPKQEMFEAIYVLGKEAGGWRVQGVELMKTDDVSV